MRNFCVKIFFLAVSLCLVRGENVDNKIPLSRFNFRNSRNCQHRPYSAFEPFYRRSILESTFYLIFIVLLGILFGLMFLGCIKGLVGLFASTSVGEYGMCMLIDLPKPLDSYRESELSGRQVCYDIAGWPVHPDTGERTVKTLPAKTEFCLNIIFFLAYPLAIIFKLCSICCCIRNYKGEEDGCFREINVIKCRSSKKDPAGPGVDMYKENDLREATDTHYVLNCLRESQMSLEKLQQPNDDYK